MRVSFDLGHDVVAEVAAEGVEDGVFGEEHDLEDVVFVADFDVDEEGLEIVEEFEVLGRFHFVFDVVVVDGDVVGLAVNRELVLDLEEDFDNVKYGDHVVFEHDVHFFVDIILEIFLGLNLKFVQFLFHDFGQEVDFEFLTDRFEGFHVVALKVAQNDLNGLEIYLVQRFLVVFEASLGQVSLILFCEELVHLAEVFKQSETD